MTDALTDLKKLLSQGKVSIGTEVALKNLRRGKAKKIFLAANCSQKIMDDVNSLSKPANVEVVRLAIPNTELGIICKKSFSIAVLSVNNE